MCDSETKNRLISYFLMHFLMNLIKSHAISDVINSLFLGLVPNSFGAIKRASVLAYSYACLYNPVNVYERIIGCNASKRNKSYTSGILLTLNFIFSQLVNFPEALALLRGPILALPSFSECLVGVVDNLI